MKDKLRELAEWMRSINGHCAYALTEILDAEGDGVAVGTYECPICGYDKPHSHEDASQFPWHMQYRDQFEQLVRPHIRQVGKEFLFGGMRLNGHNQYLAYCGAQARQEGGWAQISRSGDYENEWLNTLWAIFKKTVALTSQLHPTPARSGVVSNKDVDEAMLAYNVDCHSRGDLSNARGTAMRAALESYERSRK